MTSACSRSPGPGQEVVIESTMADVAQRAGVSVSTVSRALRASELVSPRTRERVLAAAEELSFAVSRTASSLATGRLGRVGVLVGGQLHSWFNGSILDGIYAALLDAGLELLIYRITDAGERDRFFTTLPARRNADALIVASFALTEQEQGRLEELSIPLVYLNQHVPGAASVSIDDVAGARAGTRHLLHLGHERLAFIGTDNPTGFRYSASRRVEGFRRELTSAGRPGEPEVLTVPGVTDGQEVVGQLLGLATPPTALVVESDELALSVLAACWRVGLRTPEDLSVLGFDDHALAATFGLSTVAQPVDVLARRAAELALELVSPSRPRLSGRALVTTVPTRLVLRHSTGRARPDSSRGAASSSARLARG